MNPKIRIYTDSGADITCLKKYDFLCQFFQFPYDKNKLHNSRDLALPSNTTWEKCHLPWNNPQITWENFSPSELFDEIKNLIGKNNPCDIFHIDSAYKEKCQIFLTSDKRDIHSKKAQVERLCNMKVFHPPSESLELIEYIVSLPLNCSPLN
jgi:hypothetical protein